MGCTSRWAEAWQFAGFWCLDNLMTGAHDGAGPGDAALQDNDARFTTKGVQANTGMVLYNLTDNTHGAVTAVTETTITATGVTWDNGDLYRITLIDGIQIANIEHWLDVAASDIHAALASVGACDCSLASWATSYLEKLVIIDAASYYSCPCGNPHLSDARKDTLLQWMGTQLTNIATGVIDVCDGATGANFPAMGWAQQGQDAFSRAMIIYNDILRNS